MFIPRYWSEASQRESLPERRQVTLHRFGWSSTSQEEAQVHARQRLEEALAVLRRDGPGGLRGLKRREHLVAYSGSDGLPIREEVVRECEKTGVVITRNSYGARCLNTTLAMFVDVDRSEPGGTARGWGAVMLGAGLGGLCSYLGAVPMPFLAGAGLGGFLLGAAAMVIIRLRRGADLQTRDPLQWALRQTEAWCKTHPSWRVVVYETPAGARLLPVHDLFDAGDESTFEFMDFVKADPLYKRMCRLQKCFRARVSPKPWRCGMKEHFRAGGTWPVLDREKLERRARWVERYERAARPYASCRIVETIGEGRADPRVEEIRHLHDELCQVVSRRDLA
jgi:hypothetical protein